MWISYNWSQHFSKLCSFSLVWKNCWCNVRRQHSSVIKNNPKSTRVGWTFHRSEDWTCLLWVWWATSIWTRWNRPSKICSWSNYDSCSCMNFSWVSIFFKEAVRNLREKIEAETKEKFDNVIELFRENGSDSGLTDFIRFLLDFSLIYGFLMIQAWLFSCPMWLK